MANHTNRSEAQELPLSIISKLAGGTSHLLPGESAAEYKEGLEATIAELGSKTPLQTYLAEKIFDCVWWIRRHETQKHQIVVSSMHAQLTRGLNNPPARALLEAGKWGDKGLKDAANALGVTLQSLAEDAIKVNAARLAVQDDRISDRIKALRNLQSAYEALSNRKLVIERLQLQNESIRRDMASIELKVLDGSH